MTYNPDPRRIFSYGLTTMFILIGIAAVLSVIFNPHTFTNTFSGWTGAAENMMGVLIGLFFLLFIFVWMIIWFARSIGWMPRSSRCYDHGWRL